MLFGFGRVPGCLGLGALFLWDEWREGRTDRLPAGCGIGAALDVGGVSFLRFVVRGLGIEAVLDRGWCFCVIFKFIFGVFWIIIMEKDGWPDWLTD